MKILFIECNMGAAGDMLMAALLELLSDSGKDAFLKKINTLGLKDVQVRAEPSVKHGITGTHVSVSVGGAEEMSSDISMDDACSNIHHHDHEHEHSHDSEHHHDHHSCGSISKEHHHHTQKDIEEILSQLHISDNVKKHALGVYKLLAEAESLAHGCFVSEVHFHEVGNIDAITDIVGVCLLMEELAPDIVIASPIHVGSGFVRCSHGILPVPAPATAHILKNVPSFGGKIKGELCTPTGAALLKYFVDDFDSMPQMSVEQIGYGMGKKDFEAANCVRAFLGTGASGEYADAGGPNCRIAELSCNLDDMTPEALSFACNTLMSSGALDVFTTAIGMKKNRPGIMLTCLCDEKSADTFAALILKHTTTFAVRKSVIDRYMLEREIKTAQTPLGKVRIKTGTGYGITKSKLEYEDAAALAKEHKLPIGEIERQIRIHLNHQENQK